ncbi:MAG TPA: helix-turn-helix transcriptional regulator [Longimicrobiales bacterium]
MRTLLSPLLHEDVARWQSRVNRELCGLLGADAASFMLPGRGGPMLCGEAVDPSALRAYERHYWALDVGLRVRRRELGVQVWSRRLLWSREELRRSAYYNEFVVPHRLYDAVGLTVEDESGLAGVSFYHERRSGRRFGRRAHELLRVLVPAFRAGLEAWRRPVGLGTGILPVLDALVVGVLLFDVGGRPLHANRELRRMLELDPQRERLRREAERVADTLSELARQRSHEVQRLPDGPVVRDVWTARGEYRVCGSYLEAGGSAAPCILVLVERQARDLPSDAVLQERYGLTPRQVAVARLLARGKSNAAIASALWISPHTARHHTETVLLKLGVHSRAEVAARLLRDE